MCNAGNAGAGGLAHGVADIYLADALTEAPTTESLDMPAERLQALTGGYRNPQLHTYSEIVVEDGALALHGLAPGQSIPLTAVSETRFENPQGLTLEFEDTADGRPAILMSTTVSSAVRLEPVDRYTPSEAELAAYVGEYSSHEAEVTYTVDVEEGALRLVDRYGEGRPLRPAYRDTFSGPWGMIIFRRDDTGRVNGLSMSQGRVWDLRFVRAP
jgi:hypothetical protein